MSEKHIEKITSLSDENCYERDFLRATINKVSKFGISS